MQSVKVLHRQPRKVSDTIARGLVKIARAGYDFVTRYKEKCIPPDSTMTTAELRSKGYLFTEHEWLNRILFLETTAAVPGMVAATIRHLQSLRLMKRDSGWIHTLLEEAENERMHLMLALSIIHLCLDIDIPPGRS
jgi:ubiquinol oxidase